MPHHPSRRRLRTRRVSAGLGAAAIALTTAIAGLPSGPTSAAPATPGASGSTGTTSTGAPTEPPAASLLRAAPRSVAAEATPPAAVVGENSLVSLDESALPTPTDEVGQRLSLPPISAGDAGSAPGATAGPATVVEVSGVEQSGDQTTWQGAVQGEPYSSFTLVRVGSTMRGSLVAPGGTFSLTPAEGGRYWWTRMDPRGGRTTEDDSISFDGDGAAAGGASGASGASGGSGAGAPGVVASGGAAAAGARAARKGRSKIGVMFGFTKAAQAEVGGKANLKAAAALVVAETNQAFANSGIKAKLKYRGLVKAKGKESGNAFTNAVRLFRPRDGKFDNLQRVRNRKKADVVHLFTTGSPSGTCGVGYTPSRPRMANRVAGFSTTFVSCLPYLVATHEIGHNFGADHNKYPGVTHNAKTKGSFGFANPAGGFISVMSYYEPCSDNEIQCVRVPFFSSPKNTYNGQALGDSKKTNNSKVIKMFAPRVARYTR